MYIPVEYRVQCSLGLGPDDSMAVTSNSWSAGKSTQSSSTPHWPYCHKWPNVKHLSNAKRRRKEVHNLIVSGVDVTVTVVGLRITHCSNAIHYQTHLFLPKLCSCNQVNKSFNSRFFLSNSPKIKMLIWPAAHFYRNQKNIYRTD